jgi:hypothetical protein
MEEPLKSEPIPPLPLDFANVKPVEPPVPEQSAPAIDIFAEEAKPYQPEVAPQTGNIYEPETTMPIEEIEVPHTIEPAIFAHEAQPVIPEAVIPPAAPVEPAPVQAPVVMEPTVPVTRLVQEPTIPIPPAPIKPAPVVEVRPEPIPVAVTPPPISTPEPEPVLEASPNEPETFLRTPLPEYNLEPIGLSKAPVAETPVPLSEPEPILRTPLPEYSLEPIGLTKTPAVEPVIEEPAPAPVPERKPVVPKTVMPKPVVATRTPAVKPVMAPRPVYRPEKPVVVANQPASQRKNAGAADLTRAREAAAHGDIATALRRYIKLINSNRALDQVSTDLKELVRKNPKNYLAWQTFGDARLRSNRIQEALDAYAKAADLLK